MLRRTLACSRYHRYPSTAQYINNMLSSIQYCKVPIVTHGGIKNYEVGATFQHPTSVHCRNLTLFLETMGEARARRGEWRIRTKTKQPQHRDRYTACGLHELV